MSKPCHPTARSCATTAWDDHQSTPAATSSRSPCSTEPVASSLAALSVGVRFGRSGVDDES
jgi:hypothetical protein